MKFSFCVNYPDDGFMSKCANAGAEVVRVNIDPESPNLDDLISDSTTLGIKVAVYPNCEIKQTGDVDPILKKIMTDPDSIISNYERLASLISPGRTIGFALPQGMHLIVKSRYFSKFGMKRGPAVNFLNRISAAIRSHGHEVIMPVSIHDISGDVWSGVDCDIYDIEMFLSRSAALNLSDKNLKSRLALTNKRIWFGKAGLLGGYRMPSQMVKSLKRIKDYSKKADIEYAFLWSDAAVPEFQWSHDGKMVVDIMSQSFAHINS